MSNFFHHLDLTVSDPVNSRPLYELLLGHCGFTLKSAGEDWAGFGLGDKRYPCITLLKAQGRTRSASTIAIPPDCITSRCGRSRAQMSMRCTRS